MRRRVLLGLVIAVMLAGCLNGGGNNTEPSDDVSVSDEGLSIEFSAVSSEFYTEDSSNAVFDISIENVGEGQATLQSLQLFGPSWIDSGTQVFNGEEDLRPVQTEEGLPGGVWNNEVSRSLPSVDERVSYEVGLRTRFGYTSESRSELQLLTPEEYRDRTINQQTMSETQRAAPVKITFDGNTPLEFGGEETARVPLTVSNSGSGSVVDEEVSLTVSADGSSDSLCEETVVLFDGQGQVDCNIDSYSMSGFAETVTLVAEATYTYEVENRATVDVVG